MIDAVSVIVEKMKEERLEEIKEDLEFMYYLNEEHKNNFANFLDERSYKEKFDTHGHLVAFYVNAIPSVTTGNYYRSIGLFVWIGQFDEEKNQFVPSEQF